MHRLILLAALALPAFALAAPPVKDDITVLAEQVEACIHFAGEEPYDAERGRFLARRIDQTCEPARRDLPRLIDKYRLAPKASDRLKAIKAQYEDGLGPL